MDSIAMALREIGAKTGLAIEPDENGACTLELADGRPLVIQGRADEIDFVAALGEVPEEARAAVFERLLAANFYWKGTLGATLSWNDDLGQAVLIYPIPIADADPSAVADLFERFLELQSAWRDRLAELVADGAGAVAAETVPDAPVAPGESAIINP